MKKSLLALAALTAFAGVASAQSSVTLFGVVDLNARNVKNGSAGSIKSLSTDGNASSRLGFRGVEDLGGGMRAGFWIEGGLGADVGSQGGGNGGLNAPANWNRRSTVSLLGGFGEIRLGRDYTPTFWNHTVFDPFGTNGVGSSTNIISPAPTVAPFGTAQTLVRANNTIGYFLPAMGGLYGQFMVAAGENQGNSAGSLGPSGSGNKYIGGRIGYAAGPVNFAVAYGKTEKAGVMIDDLTAFNIAGSWNLGFMTLFGQYHKYEEGARELQNYLLGATVPLGAGTFKASYGKTDRTAIFSGTTYSERGANQLALGYVYDLSKRTALYTHFSRVKNDAGLVYTAGVGGPAAPNTGISSTGYEFGVRHNF
jgi:predicted porin